MMRVLVFFVAVSLGSSNPVSNDADLMWFPNPVGDGSLIPARLKPSAEPHQANGSSVTFQLFTKTNKINPIPLTIGDATSIANVQKLPLKLLVHGFGGDWNHYFPLVLSNEYVKDAMPEDYNVILIGWSELAESPDYFLAVENAKIVSTLGSQLLAWLVQEDKAEWGNMHLIGFSLGGQIVGQIGRKVQDTFLGKVAHISSLDPALPLFDIAPEVDRITPDDADFVDVIHTAANGFVGFADPCGHVDFYVNGGRYQPGCGFDPSGSCAHFRATAYFIESVFGNLKFMAKQCHSFDAFRRGECDANADLELGHHVPTDIDAQLHGTYFLTTNGQPPYAQTNITGKSV